MSSQHATRHASSAKKARVTPMSTARRVPAPAPPSASATDDTASRRITHCAFGASDASQARFARRARGDPAPTTPSATTASHSFFEIVFDPSPSMDANADASVRGSQNDARRSSPQSFMKLNTYGLLWSASMISSKVIAPEPSASIMSKTSHAAGWSVSGELSVSPWSA